MYSFSINETKFSFPVREVRSVASSIGMDFDTDLEYHWFLQYAISRELPRGWIRETDLLGEIQYHNIHTLETTKEFPLRFKFRKAFSNLSKANLPHSYDKQRALAKELLKNVDEERQQTAFGFYHAYFEKKYQDSLPLPPGWSVRNGMYLNPDNVVQSEHPVLEYLNAMTVQFPVKDLMAISLANSVNIDMNDNIHHLLGIYKFIETNDFGEWEFRISNISYWTHAETKENNRFPFKKEALRFMRTYKRQSGKNVKKFVLSYGQRHPLYEINNKQFFSLCRKKALKLSTLFIHNSFGNKEQMQVPNKIKEQLISVNENSILNLLFSCPFKIDHVEQTSPERRIYKFSTSKDFLYNDLVLDARPSTSHNSEKNPEEEESEEIKAVQHDSLAEIVDRESEKNFIESIKKLIESENASGGVSLVSLISKPKMKIEDTIKELDDESDSIHSHNSQDKNNLKIVPTQELKDDENKNDGFKNSTEHRKQISLHNDSKQSFYNKTNPELYEKTKFIKNKGQLKNQIDNFGTNNSGRLNRDHNMEHNIIRSSQYKNKIRIPGQYYDKSEMKRKTMRKRSNSIRLSSNRMFKKMMKHDLKKQRRNSIHHTHHIKLRSSSKDSFENGKLVLPLIHSNRMLSDDSTKEFYLLVKPEVTIEEFDIVIDKEKLNNIAKHKQSSKKQFRFKGKEQMVNDNKKDRNSGHTRSSTSTNPAFKPLKSHKKSHKKIQEDSKNDPNNLNFCLLRKPLVNIEEHNSQTLKKAHKAEKRSRKINHILPEIGQPRSVSLSNPSLRGKRDMSNLKLTSCFSLNDQISLGNAHNSVKTERFHTKSMESLTENKRQFKAGLITERSSQISLRYFNSDFLKIADDLSKTPESIFAYYVRVIGHPSSKIDVQKFQDQVSDVKPVSVISMGIRLGIRASYDPYKSSESDLLWIPYLQLMVEPPREIENSNVEDHPGHLYFKTLLNYQRSHRNLVIKKYHKKDMTTYISRMSWLLFKSEKNKTYYFNFLSHEVVKTKLNIN